MLVRCKQSQSYVTVLWACHAIEGEKRARGTRDEKIV